jgi:hypothetical protein
MTHYFGFKPTEKSEVSKELLSKGINLLRVQLGQASIFGVPTFVQPEYRRYSGLLPAFIRATLLNKKVNARDVGHPISTESEDLMPLPAQRISIAFKGRHAAQSVERVREEGEELTLKGQSVFLVDHLESDREREIFGLEGLDPAAACPDEALNKNALIGLRVLNRIASGFLLTNFYPAFKDPTHVEEIKSQIDLGQPSSKRHRDEEIIEDYRHAKRVHLQDNVAAPAPAQGEDDPMAEAEVVQTVAQVMRSKEDLVSPNTKNPFPNGDFAHMPGGFGLFFAYESALQKYETDFIPTVIQQYFLGCLGTNRDQISRGFDFLRSACGIIGRTESGKIMNHIFMTIRTAIECQAQVYCVFENERYLGSAIIGYGFTISLNRELISPVSSQELQEAISHLPTHVGILCQVYGKIDWNGFEIDEDSDLPRRKQKSNWAMTRTAVQVRDDVLGSPLTKDGLIEVQGLLEKLSFKEGKKTIHVDNLVRAIQLITNTAEAIDTDWPILPSKMLSDDRVELVLSAFGFLAPTFRPNGGFAVKAGATRIKYRDFKEKSDKEIPFKKMFVRQVQLEQAVQDMKAFIKTGEILAVIFPRRSGRFSDRELVGREFSSVIGALQKLAGSVSEETVASTSAILEAGDMDIFSL